MNERCPRCEGTGKYQRLLEPERDCAVCNGTGICPSAMPEPDLNATIAELEECHAAMIAVPWEAKNRNWRNEEQPHDWYISGDIHEGEHDVDDEPDADVGWVATSVAVVPGNPTAGDIPKNTARGIATLRNLCPALLSLLRQAQTDREEIERLKEEIGDWKITSAEMDQKNEWLQKAEAELTAASERIEALERGLGDYEYDNGKRRCRFCRHEAFDSEPLIHRTDCPATALAARAPAEGGGQ